MISSPKLDGIRHDYNRMDIAWQMKDWKHLRIRDKI